MNLSTLDEQEVREFAKQNTALIAAVITPAGEALHKEDQFFGELFSVGMFVSFVKSLGQLLSKAVKVTKLIDDAKTLFKWVRSVRGAAEKAAPALSERILILLFELYVNRNSGAAVDKLATILGEPSGDVTRALEALATRGVVRKTKDGAWKYVRAR